MTALETSELLMLFEALVARNILAVYGGGRASKGHGFWLYDATPEIVSAWMQGDVSAIDRAGDCIRKDRPQSGNEYFWMASEIRALCYEA